VTTEAKKLEHIQQKFAAFIVIVSFSMSITAMQTL
jgi:hypothetical protein